MTYGPGSDACPLFSDPVAQLDLYPESKSGLLCASEVCQAGVTFSGALEVSPDNLAANEPFTMQVCRGAQVCASGTLGLANSSAPEGPPSQLAGGGAAGGEGMLATSQGWLAGQTINFTVTTMEDAAVLSDGDVYTVTVGLYGTVLWQRQATVTYDDPYLDGPQCNPFPCRTANVTLK